jgi:hypothetical protein
MMKITRVRNGICSAAKAATSTRAASARSANAMSAKRAEAASGD